MKSLFSKLALLGVSCLLCLLAAEVVFRFASASEGFLLVQQRSLAERLAEFERNRPYDVSVLAVGDSMLEIGDAQNNSFVDVVEAEASKDSLSLGVLNLGEGGSGLGGYRSLVQGVLPKLKTDVVLVAVYLGNDILEALVYQRGGYGYLPGSEAAKEASRPREIQSAAPAPQSLRAQISNAVKSNLSFLRFLFQFAKTMLPQLQSGFLEQTTERMQGVFEVDDATIEARRKALPKGIEQPYLGDILNPWDLALALVRPEIVEETLYLRESAGIPAAMVDVLTEIDTMHEVARAENAKMLVVLLPSVFTVAESAQVYYEKLGYQMNRAWLTSDFPLTQELAAALEARNIPFLYPIEALRTAAAEQELYLPRDIHHNTLGNEVLGRAVYDFLKSHLRELNAAQSSSSVDDPPSANPAHSDTVDAETKRVHEGEGN